MSKKSKAALNYHEFPKPGKVSTVPTKPCETAHDLSLAYSPGVAEPCLEIAKDKNEVYRYTSKGNLVAVISNGTAVLGLGNIGPEASKPVMEGKGVLFKSFADIDVFDIELNCFDVDSFVETVAAMEPTFGGINLEDIKSPECFEIERILRERMDIPVFHDDQHGTSIIGGAAFLNAVEVTEREISEVRVVMSGAGAAALPSARLLFQLGVKKENLLVVDLDGVIYQGREKGMNKYKEEFAVDTPHRTLAEALKDADMFLGLSAKGVLTPEMLKTMAPDPIVFALANPDPEIDYEVAKAARPDAIVATGRSDYPNQVNNVLGFPFIFRGALDVRAKGINEEMKLAAVHALANLAKEPVPDAVKAAYAKTDFSFGREYLIPKPFDSRALYYVAPAVAAAAMETGIARQNIDLEEYTVQLKARQNKGREILRRFYGLARNTKGQRVAYPEGTNKSVMTAALMAHSERLATPILLGKEEAIRAKAEEYDLDISALEIIEPAKDSRYQSYVEEYYERRNRKGLTYSEALHQMRRGNVFGNMMLSKGELDALICGVDRNYPELVRSTLEIVGIEEGRKTAAGLYIVSIGERVLFFADTSINIEMDSAKLADIAVMSAEFARSMDFTPRVAMLSFSNFGSVDHPQAKMVRDAMKLAKIADPELQIDGEMQADTASDSQILEDSYPFCLLDKPANVLIFPDMQSGNIAYKLLQRLGGARVVGPVILGLNAPAYVMQRHASVDEIFNMTTVAVAQAALMRR